MSRAERKCGVCGAHTLGYHMHARQNIGQCTATSEFETHVTIATQRSRTRHDEIAETAQSCQRIAASPFGTGQPRNLGQTPRDQRGHRVVAEPQSVDNAGGNRDDVFQRAADLHPATSSLA